MKKLIALLMSLLLLLTAVPALAEVEMIDYTDLSLDLGDLDLYELTDEDLDDEMVLYCANEDESLIGMVYVFDADGYTLQELADELLADEEDVTASGYTTINGIECFYMVIVNDAEDYSYVIYFTILDDTVVQFEFAYDGDEAAQLSGTVMNTLTLN